MRLPIAVVAALLVLPASAQAGVVGLEGTQIVYRGDPGVADRLIFTDADDVIIVKSLRGELRLGPGCADGRLGVTCALAGVTGLTILSGDGADDVEAYVPVPITLDLGAGDDSFDVSGGSVTVVGGPGNDRGVAAAATASVSGGEGDDGFEIEGEPGDPGPHVVDGGPGDDSISIRRRGNGTSLVGGEGDDKLYATAVGPAAVSIVCGPGADQWVAYPRDTPGDGCAAHLAGITTKTVSRAFREGALTGPASGSVTLIRRSGLSGSHHETIARGTFTAQAGPLRLSLKRTRAGTRWLRRIPHLPVFVTIRTRTGTDRGETTFRSKVG